MDFLLHLDSDRSKVALQGYKIPNLLEACGLLMVGLTAYIAQVVKSCFLTIKVEWSKILWKSLCIYC